METKDVLDVTVIILVISGCEIGVKINQTGATSHSLGDL